MSQIQLLLASCVLLSGLSCSSTNGDRQGAASNATNPNHTSSVPTGPCAVACPMTGLTARVLSGWVTFALDGGPSRHQALSADDAPSTLSAGSGRCAAANFVTLVLAHDISLGGDAWLGCEPAEGSLKAVVANIDPRTLTAGTQVFPWGGSKVTFSAGSCVSASSEGTVTIEVTRAEGGNAPYPAGVTADYVREFNVHMESQSGANAADQGCPAIATTVDLQFATVTADAVNDPDAICYCL
jgi:hypothetical protein